MLQKLLLKDYFKKLQKLPETKSKENEEKTKEIFEPPEKRQQIMS